jgi:hypothetical protein
MPKFTVGQSELSVLDSENPKYIGAGSGPPEVPAATVRVKDCDAVSFGKEESVTSTLML